MNNVMIVRFASALIASCGAFAIQANARGDEPPPAARDADGVPVQGKVAFDPAASPALQVKRIKSGHILVRPTVNGHDAGWYIFDTGAGICCVSTPTIKELDLQPNGSIQANGVGGSKAANLYNAKQMKLGPMTFNDHPLMEIDLSFLEPLVGEKISGIIGYGVLSNCVGEIDLGVPSIALFDPGTYTLSSGQWTPVNVNDRIPSVAGKFEGRDGTFRLDLGATGSVTFHQPSVVKYDMLKDRPVTDCKMGGFGGFVAGKRGKIASLELGGTKFEDVDADFALEAKGTFAESSKDANIGTDILKRFVLISDYPKGRMAFVLKPAASMGAAASSSEPTATK